MSKYIVFLSLVIFGGCAIPQEPDSNTKYVTAEKVVIQNCGASPCVLKLKSSTKDSEYNGITILNPQTQTFQSRIYVTNSITFNFKDGIVYIGGNNYLQVVKTSKFHDDVVYNNIIIKDISPELQSEYSSLYWKSMFYDFLFIIGIIIALIIIGIIATAFGRGMQDTIDFLGTKQGKKLLKKLDKDIRTDY